MSHSPRDMVYSGLLERSIRPSDWEPAEYRSPFVRSTDVSAVDREITRLDGVGYGDGPSEETIRRTLRAATSLGVVSHRAHSQRYQLAHSDLRERSERRTATPSTPDPSGEVTARDLAWLAIIRVSVRRGVDGESFSRRDLERELAEEEAVEAPSGETIRRTLKGARDLGVIADGPSGGRYHLAGVEVEDSDSGSHSEPAEVEPDGGSEEWELEAIADLSDRWQIDGHQAEAALEDMGVLVESDGGSEESVSD